jgi:protein arginine kinase activator
MLCDDCGKEPAKIHYKEMKENEVTEYHLCEQCALEKGIQISHQQEEPFSLPNMMTSMAEEIGSDVGMCGTCGLSYREFRDSGRLGCSDCYEAFKEQLKPLLRRIHGSNAHSGKSPRVSQGAFERRRELEALKVEIGRAIESEDFETAAEIRDKIKDLEKKPEDSPSEN